MSAFAFFRRSSISSPVSAASLRCSADVFARAVPFAVAFAASSASFFCAASRSFRCFAHASPVIVLTSMLQAICLSTIWRMSAAGSSRGPSISGCWMPSMPASTDSRSPSGVVEWVSAFFPRLCASSTITRCASGEKPMNDGRAKWAVPPNFTKSGPLSRYALMATRSSSGVMSTKSSPAPCVI